jgi:hypothetical protein
MEGQAVPRFDQRVLGRTSPRRTAPLARRNVSPLIGHPRGGATDVMRSRVPDFCRFRCNLSLRVFVAELTALRSQLYRPRRARNGSSVSLPGPVSHSLQPRGRNARIL